MKKIIVVFVLFMGANSHAGSSSVTGITEGSLYLSMIGTFSPTILSDCAVFQDCHSLKIVMDAREDAALFVATDGKIKTVRFTLALETLRIHQAEGSANLTDLDLAQAILAL